MTRSSYFGVESCRSFFMIVNSVSPNIYFYHKYLPGFQHFFKVFVDGVVTSHAYIYLCRYTFRYWEGTFAWTLIKTFVAMWKLLDVRQLPDSLQWTAEQTSQEFLQLRSS